MTLTLRCIVVDDEPLARDLIAAYVEKTPSMELLGKYSSGEEAHARIARGDVDIAFLDINMPRLGGMELARLIPPRTRIIFITAYDRFALEGFKVNALDYLMKPVSYSEFAAAANRAFRWVELREKAGEADRVTLPAASSPESPRYIIVKSEYRMKQLPVGDILFVEGLKDYVRFFMSGEESPVISQMSMKRVEDALPQEFMRVHRSYLVNTSRITVIERGRIIFGRHYIPVGDSYRQAFADFLASRQI